jgi:hypothetical protein
MLRYDREEAHRNPPVAPTQPCATHTRGAWFMSSTTHSACAWALDVKRVRQPVPVHCARQKQAHDERRRENKSQRARRTNGSRARRHDGHAASTSTTGLTLRARERGKAEQRERDAIAALQNASVAPSPQRERAEVISIPGERCKSEVRMRRRRESPPRLQPRPGAYLSATIAATQTDRNRAECHAARLYASNGTACSPVIAPAQLSGSSR